MGRVGIGIGHFTLVLCVGLGGLTPGGGTDARADISPGLAVGIRHDDPASGPDGTGQSWIGDIMPMLLLERLGPFTTWDIRAQRRYDTEENSGRLRVNHDYVSAQVRNEPAEHTTFTLGGSYFHSRDAMQPDPEAQIAPSSVEHASGTAALDFWRAEAGIDIDAIRYNEPGYTDGGSLSWYASAFPYRSEQSMGLIGWRREQWRVQGDAELISSVATLGMRRQHTPGLSSELEVGVAHIVDELAASRRNDLALVAGMNGFGYALGLPFDARVRIEHDVATTGLAEIWRPMAGARIGLKWERTLETVGGVIHEVALRDFVTLGVQDTLGGRSIVSIEGSYRLASPRVNPDERLETWRGMASVTRDLRPWLRGRVRYSTAHQMGSGSLQTSDYDRERLEVSLTAVYQ